MVMVPVFTAHVGCAVTDATGCDGDDGALFTVTPVNGVEVPHPFFAVTE